MAQIKAQQDQEHENSSAPERKPRQRNAIAAPGKLEPPTDQLQERARTESLESISEDDSITDDISISTFTDDTSNLDIKDIAGTGMQKLSQKEKREAKQAAKISKAQETALRNKARVVNDILESDIVAVAVAIHGDSTESVVLKTVGNNGGHSPDIDYDLVAENIGYNCALKMHVKWLRKEAKQSHPSQREKTAATSSPCSRTAADKYSPELKEIMTKLCVNIDLKVRKKTAELIRKLAIAVEDDITTCLNDESATMVRAAGYWRYVNKGIYNKMIRNNEFVNWKTGENLVKAANSDTRLSLSSTGPAGAGDEEADKEEQEKNIEDLADAAESDSPPETPTESCISTNVNMILTPTTPRAPSQPLSLATNLTTTPSSSTVSGALEPSSPGWISVTHASNRKHSTPKKHKPASAGPRVLKVVRPSSIGVANGSRKPSASYGEREAAWTKMHRTRKPTTLTAQSRLCSGAVGAGSGRFSMDAMYHVLEDDDGGGGEDCEANW